MIENVQASLNAVLGSVTNLANANGSGRIFELFVMTGIAVELQNLGFEVWLQRSDGTRILPTDVDRTFVQRGGAPSAVPLASSGSTNASVIGFRRLPAGSGWEIWNGIQFEGRSGGAHELDIAIVPRDTGIALRQTGGMPYGRPRVAIECKDVGTAGSLDETRAFVARLYDLTLLQWHQPHVYFPPPMLGIFPGPSNHPFYSARATYWQENRNTFNVIARRTGFSQGTGAMTSYYSVQPHGFITLNSPEATGLITAVCQWISTRCP